MPTPRVLDAEDDLVSSTAAVSQMPSPRLGVLGGVVEQVEEDLGEPGGIGIHDDGLGREVDGQAMARAVDERAAALDGGSDDPWRSRLALS